MQTTYTYDVDNRLIQSAIRNPIINYYYDPFGKRLWKEVNGVKTYFLYSDEGLIGEYNLSDIKIKTYGYAPDSTWTTNPIFVKIGANYYWYQSDHLGTPQKLVDSSGRVVWSATYDSFGEAIVAVAAVENNLRLPGQYYDQETDLHYNWNRYYDPKTGRYLTPDPIGLEGGNNLFLYVNSDPLNGIDEKGLYTCTYYVSTHRMICYPSSDQHLPSFDSNHWVSGRNTTNGRICSDCQNCLASTIFSSQPTIIIPDSPLASKASSLYEAGKPGEPVERPKVHLPARSSPPAFRPVLCVQGFEFLCFSLVKPDIGSAHVVNPHRIGIPELTNQQISFKIRYRVNLMTLHAIVESRRIFIGKDRIDCFQTPLLRIIHCHFHLLCLRRYRLRFNPLSGLPGSPWNARAGNLEDSVPE